MAARLAEMTTNLLAKTSELGRLSDVKKTTINSKTGPYHYKTRLITNLVPATSLLKITVRKNKLLTLCI